ncbi:MAG TPA: Gfo/Idh/MocA family oxidoreductase [Acidisarcina sp.]
MSRFLDSIAPDRNVSQPTLSVAVIGAGVFGRNHLRVYRELSASGYPVAVSAIVEPDDAAASRLRAETGLAVFPSVEACVAARHADGLKLDAASVCVPTSFHATVASTLMADGIDVLLEKPIAASLEEADSLLRLAETSGRVLQVGHLERFNPAVLAIQPYLNGPMFFEAHRLSVFTPRSLDVDVVLDLMIHDLDIVLSMTRSPVMDLRAVGLPILSSKVDIANVRVEFESGCVANFTASRVSTERVRKLRFFQPRQYVSIDYARKDLLVIDVAGEIQRAAGRLHGGSLPEVTAEQQRAAADSGLAFSKPRVEAGEPLRLEIESFLGCVRSRCAPRVSGEDGRAALALALEIREVMIMHSRRAGLEKFYV